MDTLKRFAIRISPGLYSDGPRCHPVPLNKAKLWTNIGHIKNHLHGVGRKAYPATAEVLEVEVSFREVSVPATMVDLQQQLDSVKAEKDAEWALIRAEQDLAAAQRRRNDIAIAEEKLRKAKAAVAEVLKARGERLAAKKAEQEEAR